MKEASRPSGCTHVATTTQRPRSSLARLPWRRSERLKAQQKSQVSPIEHAAKYRPSLFSLSHNLEKQPSRFHTWGPQWAPASGRITPTPSPSGTLLPRPQNNQIGSRQQHEILGDRIQLKINAIESKGALLRLSLS